MRDSYKKMFHVKNQTTMHSLALSKSVKQWVNNSLKSGQVTFLSLPVQQGFSTLKPQRHANLISFLHSGASWKSLSRVLVDQLTSHPKNTIHWGKHMRKCQVWMRLKWQYYCGPPGVSFINILHAAFTCADPKSAKNSQVKQLFALLGSVHVKAVRKKGDEIDPSFLLYYFWVHGTLPI